MAATAESPPNGEESRRSSIALPNRCLYSDGFPIVVPNPRTSANDGSRETEFPNPSDQPDAPPGAMLVHESLIDPPGGMPLLARRGPIRLELAFQIKGPMPYSAAHSCAHAAEPL
jgi:hypothetical protein